MAVRVLQMRGLNVIDIQGMFVWKHLQCNVYKAQDSVWSIF